MEAVEDLQQPPPSSHVRALPPPLDLTEGLVKLCDSYLEGGRYGDVYMCHYNNGPNATKVAVKALRVAFDTKDENDKHYRMFRRELGIWRRLRHKNVVPFLGVARGFGRQGAVSFMSLWMPNGTLGSFLKQHEDELNTAHRLRLLLDIAHGLVYLHSFTISDTRSPIIHGDLYPNNVLICEDYTARLTDFGFASLMGEIPELWNYLQRSTARPGALRWSAPEQIVGKTELRRAIKSDIYSFGSVALQVLSDKQPWSEFQAEGRIAVALYQDEKPARPDHRLIEDHHWEFINRCWATIDERPEAMDLVSALEQFLSDYPNSQPLSEFFASSSKHLTPVGDSSVLSSAIDSEDSARPGGSSRPIVYQDCVGRDDRDDMTPSTLVANGSSAMGEGERQTGTRDRRDKSTTFSDRVGRFHLYPRQQATMTSAQRQAEFVPDTRPVAQQRSFSMTAPSFPLHSQSLNQGYLSHQIPMPPTWTGRPGTIPPQSGGTLHQLPGQLPNALSSNMGTFGMQPQGGQEDPTQIRRPIVMLLDKLRFETMYLQFCRSYKLSPVLRVSLPDNRTVEVHQLHVQVMLEGGEQSVTQRDMWSIIGGRLGFIEFPGTDTELARCGPGTAQHLQHAYKEYLQDFEHAYVVTVKTRTTTASPQQPMQFMNPLIPGNAAAPSAPRPFNPQSIATAARYAYASVPDMRAQNVPEQLINFVGRHRADLIKLYQQHFPMKLNGEQESQNVVSGSEQIPNMHEQVGMGMQPDKQRPYQSGGSGTGSMIPEAEPRQLDVATAVKEPTQDQIQHPLVTIASLKNVFQQRLNGMPTQQIPDEQRPEYNQLLERVHKMSSELDTKLHIHFVVLKNEEVLRKSVAIVMTVAKQRQLVSTSSPQYIVNLMTLRSMQLRIQKLNEEFEVRWRAIKAAAAANS